jgi:transposase
MDSEGFPVGYDLFPGNTYDGKTLVPALDRLKTKFRVRRVIIVADRGVNSKSNLCEIKKAGYEYIVAARLKNMNTTVKKAIFDDAGYKATGDDKDSLRVKSIDYDNIVELEDGSKVHPGIFQ